LDTLFSGTEVWAEKEKISTLGNLENTYSEQFGEQLGNPKDELELTMWQCGCGQAFFLIANWCKISPFAG
jgi:hypothetical protein